VTNVRSPINIVPASLSFLLTWSCYPYGTADGSFVETSSGQAARELKKHYDRLLNVNKELRSPYAITAFVNQHGKPMYRVGYVQHAHSCPRADDHFCASGTVISPPQRQTQNIVRHCNSSSPLRPPKGARDKRVVSHMALQCAQSAVRIARAG
jgi:hypothetical protein